MANDRTLMENALKEVFIQKLREFGFKGSLPHFRRFRENQIDLLSFQFHSAGGSFVIEIAKAPIEGITTSWGKFIPPEKTNVTWVNNRLRLGSKPEIQQNDHWFEFGSRSYEPTQIQNHYQHYLSVAQNAASFIHSQAEPWWHAS